MFGESINAWEAIHRLMMSVGWIVSFGCSVALIVVIATVVRRHRPDAWGTLLTWSIVSAVSMIVSPILFAVLPILIRGDGGITGIYKSQVAAQSVLIPIHVGLVVLLIRGLVRLAQPAPKVDVGPTPPYR